MGSFGGPRFARADEGFNPWSEDEDDVLPLWLRANPFGPGATPSASGYASSPSPARRGGRGRQRRRGAPEGMAAAAFLAGSRGAGFHGLNQQALALAVSDRDFGADDYEALLVLASPLTPVPLTSLQALHISVSGAARHTKSSLKCPRIQTPPSYRFSSPPQALDEKNATRGVSKSELEQSTVRLPAAPTLSLHTS